MVGLQRCFNLRTNTHDGLLHYPGVYAFGFLFMLPQLFLNYKVGSYCFMSYPSPTPVLPNIQLTVSLVPRPFTIQFE